METTNAPVIPPPVTNPTAPVATTGGNDQYVGFVPRLVAGFIDGIIVGVISGVVNNIVENQGLVSTLIGAAYYIGMWVNNNGMTLGKQIMNIKIVTTSGQPLDYKTAVIRYVGYIISAIPLFLGYFWVLFDPKKQAWHDKIANTYVVKK